MKSVSASTSAQRGLFGVSAEQISALEELFTPQWPDVWRELARSLYATMLTNCTPQPLPAEAAAQAIALARGVGLHMGGAQWYIPAGFKVDLSDRRQLVLDLLASGTSYRSAAAQTGLTEPTIRKIERQSRQRKRDTLNALAD